MNKEENLIEQWEEEITEQGELEVVEEGAIYNGNGISIHVDPRSSYGKSFSAKPYIKIYDNERASKAKREMRISLDDLNIIYHKDRFWKRFDELKMTTSLADKLTDIVNNEKSNVSSHKGTRVLDAIYDEIQTSYPDAKFVRREYIDFNEFFNKEDDKKKKKGK